MGAFFYVFGFILSEEQTYILALMAAKILCPKLESPYDRYGRKGKDCSEQQAVYVRKQI